MYAAEEESESDDRLQRNHLIILLTNIKSCLDSRVLCIIQVAQMPFDFSLMHEANYIYLLGAHYTLVCRRIHTQSHTHKTQSPFNGR